MRNKGFAHVFLILGIVVVGIIAAIFLAPKNISAPVSPTVSPIATIGTTPMPPENTGACTMDAKQCPDGSYVGRTGPKCEFTDCPKTTPTDEQQTSNFFDIPDIPLGYKSKNKTQEISLIAYYKNSSKPIDLNLNGTEWNYDENIDTTVTEQALNTNLWETTVPSFSLGDYEFSTVSADGPGGSTIGFFKIGEKTLRVITIYSDNGSMNGKKPSTKIFISDIYTKEHLLSIAQQEGN